jgi:hypothetical protein
METFYDGVKWGSDISISPEIFCLKLNLLQFLSRFSCLPETLFHFCISDLDIIIIILRDKIKSVALADEIEQKFSHMHKSI